MVHQIFQSRKEIEMRLQKHAVLLKPKYGIEKTKDYFLIHTPMPI